MNDGTRNKLSTGLLLTALLLMGAGCATNRGYISLNLPAETAATTTDRTVAIRSVADMRRFADNPDDPSTPSLGFGGIEKVSADERKRAIARKRNSYGKALGDIFLDEGQTVELLVSDLLKSSMRELGYTVVEHGQARADTLLMDVTIEKFWAWFTPGFWAITLRSEIATTVNISKSSGGAGETRTIAASAEGSEVGASTRAWKSVYHKGFENYKESAKAQLRDLK